MNMNNLVKCSKEFLKESFDNGLEKQAWVFYVDFDGSFSSGMTISSKEEVDKFYLKGCRYYIDMENVE